MAESFDFEPPLDGKNLAQHRRRLGISIRAYMNRNPAYGEQVGPIIVSVEPGGLAERSGVEDGDIVLEIDGRSIEKLGDGKTDLASVAINYWTTHASRDIVLGVKREGETALVRIVIPADCLGRAAD